jgi:2-oxoglutarate dehydrogenase E2 component (dihydrolipoamide succinyltransferase)
VQAIAALGKKARDGTISIDDMAGGTFTISNGGVYGSMLSTPIINPPQSAILGMHAITQRAMVVGKEILPRPVMNVALTYDHRLIDGREVSDRQDLVMQHPVSLMSHVVRKHVDAMWPLSCLQAVTFLKRLKEVIEDPRRMLLGV